MLPARDLSEFIGGEGVGVGGGELGFAEAADVAVPHCGSRAPQTYPETPRWRLSPASRHDPAALGNGNFFQRFEGDAFSLLTAHANG